MRGCKMCGLAGYNASPAWVKEHMTDGKQFKVLEQCWIHNEHRGTDAAGYFRVDANDDLPYVRKRGMSATEMLDVTKDQQLISPSLVFAAHTRAATQGKAEDNRNNHPVEYGQLLVTHNGTIVNDKMFKHIVPMDKKGDIGQVDSYAIPIALDVVEDPHDIEHILEVLPKLNGSLAFHAIWKNFPGVSLIVRGPRSPLVIRWHPSGIVAYASEEDALFAFIEETGMDPNDPEWEIRKLDEFTALVVEYGVPVKWGSYKKRGWTPSMGKLEYFVKRIFQGDQKRVVVSHDDKNAWDARMEDSLLKHAREGGNTKLIFTAKQGFKDQNTKVALPMSIHQSTYASLIEADKIYEHKNKPLLYAQFGHVELVIGQHDGKVKDVYNHSKYGENVVRRVVETKEVPDNDADKPGMEWDEWLVKSTTKIHSPIKERTVPKTQRKAVHVNSVQGHGRVRNPTKGGVKVNSSKSTQASSPATVTNIIAAAKIQREYDPNGWPFPPDVISLKDEVRWVDMQKYETHPTAPMGFLLDQQCQDHKGTVYSAHERPEECEKTVLASIGFASCISDVSLWYEIDPSIKIITRGNLTKKGVDRTCFTAEGRGCDWQGYLWRQVRIGASEMDIAQVMEILVGEICAVCQTKMFIRRLPDYMEAWTGDREYVS